MHITTDTFKKRGETRFSSHFWTSNELNEDIDLKKKQILGCYNWYKVSEIRPGLKSRKLLIHSCTMT